MQGYKLTERGKIVIAVMIVMVLLVLSAILTGKAIINQASTNPSGQDPGASGSLFPYSTDMLSATSYSPPPVATQSESSTPDTTQPESSTSDTTQPESSTPDTTQPESSAPDTTQPESSAPGTTQPETALPGISPPTSDSGQRSEESSSESEHSIPPRAGPTGGNPFEGTLSFSFFPDNQTELDADTTALLFDLLNSPKNTRNSIITVETSMMSETDIDKLMTALISAFTAYGVSEQRITHNQRQSGTTSEAYEVNLYFIPVNEK